MFDQALFDQIVFDGLVAPPTPAVCFWPNPRAHNGYLCFMEQYIKNKVKECSPLKLPDGTIW